MEPTNEDVQEVQETPEDAEETVETPETVEISKEELESLRKKAEASSHNFERAKKAEEKAKKLETDKTPKGDLSSRDVIYLAKADIHPEDMDELLEWAKFKKVDVAEAHKQLKATLDIRNEQRKTAEATQTGRSARGTNKVNGDELLNQAQRTGEIPDDAEGMQALFQARLKRQLGVK